ncbi:MAG: DUF5362 family protein [Lentimicrobiaceae bacterium]|jgi:hypothetical protein
MDDTTILSETDSSTEIPQLTSGSVAFLLTAAKWGKFLAILGFIITGLILAAGILMSFVMNTVQDEMLPLNMPFSPKILSIVYMVIAAIYLIPVIFLNSFSNNVLKAVNRSSTENMTTAIRNLKNMFVFIGISTILILVLYTLALILIGTAALFSF